MDLGLNSIFFPRSIAVVGASTEQLSLGHHILNNIIKGGFQGKLYPVNPHTKEILGLKAYPNVNDIPDSVDLVMVTVRSEVTTQVIQDAVKKGVKAAIILSGGFKEFGAEGKRLEEKLLQVARAGGLRILGPNCQGVINNPINMNASIGSQAPFLKQGVISFLSQGGDSGHGVLLHAYAEDLGINKYVGLGNMCDLDFIDFLDYLRDDESTKIIMMYIAGLQRGREFLELAKEMTKIKPIVAFKMGKTEEARRVELTHTGSLGGSHQIYESAFKQAGIISCQEPLEMLDVAKALVMQPLPQGNGIAIVTMVGGPGVTAAETCALKGVSLCQLSRSTRAELKRVSPPQAITVNPVDLTWGGVSTQVFSQALKIVASDENVSGLIMIRKVTFEEISAELTVEMMETVSRINKPMVACWIGEAGLALRIAKVLQAANVPTYPSPDRAARAMAGLVQYARIKKQMNLPANSLRF